MMMHQMLRVAMPKPEYGTCRQRIRLERTRFYGFVKRFVLMLGFGRGLGCKMVSVSVLPAQLSSSRRYFAWHLARSELK